METVYVNETHKPHNIIGLSHDIMNLIQYFRNIFFLKDRTREMMLKFVFIFHISQCPLHTM